MRNNFWISQLNTDTLIIYEYRCPLDYCKDVHIGVSSNDPSVQCDFNRNGILCGKCADKFSLALGSLHYIPCDNKHIPLVLLYTIAGMGLVATMFLLQLTLSVGSLNGLFFYAKICIFLVSILISLLSLVSSWVHYPGLPLLTIDC